jgi:saccharopine dehydrogenase-like NADP-dependent oxidoreductase
MKLLVLGAGLVGGPMAIDLAKDSELEVTAVDLSSQALDKLSAHSNINTLQKDLSEPAVVKTLAAEHDIVLNAVPGFMGFATLQAIIEAGKDVVDIAFYSEDPFTLDRLAKEKGVTAIVDCGVAPGMSNLLIGHLDRQLDKTTTVLIYVGGLPEVRQWPFEYKAVFSPIDVIAEYTRPARYVENGVLVTREALSDPELLNFPGIGTLEAFNSDGLRTLAVTIDAPNMKEKTLRYQGHIEKMAVLREAGFFSEEEVTVNGARLRPIDFTAEIMFPKWKLEEGEVDITVLQIIVEGEQSGKSVRYVYDLLDRYDPVTRTHSMARTTGYAATVAVRMLAAGLYRERGISPPELVGRHKPCVDFMLSGLEERGLVFDRKIVELGAPVSTPPPHRDAAAACDLASGA